MTQSNSTRRSRFTIERLRTLVLVGAAVLVVAIGAFLYTGNRLRRFLKTDLPKRLGVDIESQADGVNYTQSRKGKTLFQLHASRAVRMKEGGKSMLHDVTIELYGEDGKPSDTISGSEFEYDPNAGVAKAVGVVEITLERPQEKPAIAQMKPGEGKSGVAGGAHPDGKSASPNSNGTVHSGVKALPGQVTDSEIHVKTSGLAFNQKTGVAVTDQRVDFALSQGSGTSMGATYDSSTGQLILDHAVELHILKPAHGAEKFGEGTILVQATHADFERAQHLCLMTQARAETSSGTAQMANALLHFRDDGSVLRLDGSGGVDLQSRGGAEVTAPRGNMEFEPNNRPQKGLLQGGTQFRMSEPNRDVEGTSPTAHLAFDSQGQLHQMHLEQGVQFKSRQTVATAKGVPAEVRRTWKSQTADVEFAAATAAKGRRPGETAAESHPNQVEARTVHGFGGVVITSASESSGVVTPSRLAADTVVAQLAPGAVLSSLSGAGHANCEQRTATGATQTSSSDTLDVRFDPAPVKPADSRSGSRSGGSEIASMVQTGHVVMTQKPPARPAENDSTSGNGSSAETAEIRATASRADYDGKSQILHLSGAPRIEDGALDMTANLIDFNRATSDAFAHGDVKASWSGGNGGDSQAPGATMLSTSGPAEGGNGPVHAIAAEAELHQASQEAVFRGASQGGLKNRNGNLAKLWQSADSVTAPVITLNRKRQTLDAESRSTANPVFTVLVSNPPATGSKGAAKSNKSPAPSVIRVRSGNLHYSEGERLAEFERGELAGVTAETSGPDGDSTVVSQQAEVRLLPAGVRPARTASPSGSASVAASRAAAPSTKNSSIDSLTATGHVTVDWPDRKGTGEKLVYRAENGEFTLTGTGAAPPRITDAFQGTVTGSALIFDSRNDSVTVVGDGGKTVTDTVASRKRPQAN